MSERSERMGPKDLNEADPDAAEGRGEASAEVQIRRHPMSEREKT